MAVVQLGDVEIAFDVHGYEDDPPLLLIAGLGAQMIFFEDEFVQGLVDRAFRVIRLDNRDAGHSTIFGDHSVDLGEVLAAIESGETVELPYGLEDMAGDVLGLLDHLGIDRAHLFGVSLGGMIAQTVAIHHPERVQSLTLLSSTTGSTEVGQPSPEALEALLGPGVEGDRAEIVADNVRTRQIWSTLEHFDEAWTQAYFEAAYDRSHEPGGVTRQLAAILCEPSREDLLEQLSVPTLVLHGTDDTLISPDGGHRLAELIPDATFVELEGMSHDLPPHYWAPIIESVTQLAIRSLS